MNLALEYLVRTKSIRNFFDTPSSLFLERGGEKMVITFDGNVGDQSIRIKRWPISDIPVGSFLPKPSLMTVGRGEFFEYDLIPEGYSILKYCEEPVDTSLNSYKKPMMAETYQWFVDHMLYSETHRYFKEYWLWEAFFCKALSQEARFLYPEREMLLTDFAERGGDNHPWHLWRLWKRTLLPDKDIRAACELIFMS